MQATPVVATDGPRFELLYGAPSVVRRSAPASDIASALFVNGAQRSFVDNVMVQNTINVREGEWVRYHPSTGLINKALPSYAPCWPVWQDPGAGRRDGAVGGLTFLQGHWTVATNMITDGFHDGDVEFSVNALVEGQELKVATLPAAHKYAGAIGLAPINWDDGVVDPTARLYVVAHVERVFADKNVVVINNYQAGYPVTVTQVLTTLAPTTPAPTTV